ncbi:chorismate mutase [uncultured Granulicatella sp.]|jgi:chorismate mutase|uniref:chorismate mutase n=1 Tax=uncultured Granulicatella sp. TaxID=316089 RepID=UPI0026073D80|nr:chorismate mutase [uncultured Granulicatella sp.]
MLDKQRAEIDVIDREIVSLFERRMQVVMDVARIKKENGIAIFDASREKEVIAKVQSYLKDATLKEELAEAYETLMKVSKDYQQKQIKA